MSKDTIEELVSEINNLNGGKTKYTLDQLFNDHELGMCVGLDNNFSGDEHRKAHQRFREMTKEWLTQALIKAKEQGAREERERVGEKYITLMNKALGDTKLPESVWEKIAKVNSIILK